MSWPNRSACHFSEPPNFCRVCEELREIIEELCEIPTFTGHTRAGITVFLENAPHSLESLLEHILRKYFKIRKSEPIYISALSSGLSVTILTHLFPRRLSRF